MAKISTIWELYLFYGLIVGVGMGGGIAPSLSTVARWFVKRRGLMTGMTVAGTATGTLENCWGQVSIFDIILVV